MTAAVVLVAAVIILPPLCVAWIYRRRGGNAMIARLERTDGAS